MAVFGWRQIKSANFGQIWVPVASASLTAGGGAFHTFLFAVDSGAIISVLGGEVVARLGIMLEAGKRVEISSVGGGKLIAYIHHLPTRIGDDNPMATVPFAVTADRGTPNLLGRLGVFDRFRVEFDGKKHTTTIA